MPAYFLFLRSRSQNIINKIHRTFNLPYSMSANKT
nr:MAG TPA: hypothetical protein [Caudoviricetes sp.]DAN57398.1 MAG TPA: hypothetical protein [Caudoviricetes sp.]